MLNSARNATRFLVLALQITLYSCVNTHDMTVYGKVMRADGTPISGAKVSVNPRTAFSHIYETTSDEFGLYKIDEGQFDLFYVNEALDPTHEITIQAVHPNFRFFKTDIEFKEDKYRYDIVLEP